MADKASLEDKLRILRQIYFQQLPERIEEIALAWAKLKQSDNILADFATLRNLIHRLSGSAGTYGLEQLSQASKQVEYALERIDLDNFFADETYTELSKAVFELEQIARKSLLQFQEEDGSNTPKHKEKTKKKPKKTKDFNVLYLQKQKCFDDDWAMQLRSYGYNFTLKCYDELKGKHKKLKQNTTYDVIIIDDFARETQDQIIHEVIQSFVLSQNSVPMIFIGKDDDIETRLSAVRLGSHDFLVKPLDINELIDKLNHIAHPEEDEAVRVIVVDDELAQAEYAKALLEDAGMEVVIITNPLKIMQPLFDFKPDIVVMDLYMPECTGMEMASVIRQLESFVSLPIIYLSSESRFEKQVVAMRKGGGDAFLTKPVIKEHLIETIHLKVNRLRSLRAFMVRDSLTGLYNHSSLLDGLSTQLSQCRRQEKNAFCFALIDIDYFKKVNDTYGHLVGDRVLKRLSQFFKQRLRKGDVIGRYGGEEFGIILPNTHIEDAFEVLDRLREEFSHIKHPYNKGEDYFHVTLSIGISGADGQAEGMTAIDVTQAADKALYACKAGGRNRVIIADS